MLRMPLLLFDLDNTLLPRDAAFRAWAQDFLDEHRLPATDLDWFSTIDGGGYVPRSTVLGAAKRRYGFDYSLEYLLAHYRRGINSHIHCPASHVEALRAARAAGWTLGIVSNGGTRAQLEKIRRTGLSPLVDGWVISEEARCVKPDPQIFEIAAQRCGVPPVGDWTTHTWMVGDHAPADIAGAEVTGLRSVWLHQGRPWAEPGYRPTLSAPGLPEAVGLVLTARNAPSAQPGRRPQPQSQPRTRRPAPVSSTLGTPAGVPAASAASAATAVAVASSISTRASVSATTTATAATAAARTTAGTPYAAAPAAVLESPLRGAPSVALPSPDSRPRSAGWPGDSHPVTRFTSPAPGARHHPAASRAASPPPTGTGGPTG